MSVAEMKKIITEKVNVLNEDQLKEVDIFLNKINSIPIKELDLSKHVKDIINERGEVLQRLAQ